MTQEDKDLLLKDLCARLPYGIKAALGNESNPNPYTIYGITPSATMQSVIAAKSKDGIPIYTDNILGFKPYLRPMSSMTEEEKNEILILMFDSHADKFYITSEGEIAAKDTDLMKEGLNFVSFHPCNIDIYENYLNSHHFDYRGLIEKGLAIEAPSDMYNLKH